VGPVIEGMVSQRLTPLRLAVEWSQGAVKLLDQTQLPAQENYLRCEKSEDVVDGIRRLVVRGAPAIGVAGAFGVVLAAKEALSLPEANRWDEFCRKLEALSAARPTAVNLTWAVERVKAIAKGQIEEASVEILLSEARKIHEEDIEANRSLARIGADLFPNGKSVMTYCNTGDLATGGIGTALGVIRQAYLDGKVEHVYTCETRPVLQGLRLTAWELEGLKIPYTAICDNMAAQVMRGKNVGAVIVGADRIAANGDAANKIGTYGLAVLARFQAPSMQPMPINTPAYAKNSHRFIVVKTQYIPQDRRPKKFRINATQTLQRRLQKVRYVFLFPLPESQDVFIQNLVVSGISPHNPGIMGMGDGLLNIFPGNTKQLNPDLHRFPGNFLIVG